MPHAGEQFVVRAQPHRLAVLQHEDLVGVLDGRDPLGDDDDGGVASVRLHRGAQPCVGGHVERGERVVEQVHVGFADERSGDGEPLPLTARHVGAALG